MFSLRIEGSKKIMVSKKYKRKNKIVAIITICDFFFINKTENQKRMPKINIK
tara:strand:+ start:50 stop:205 length:156 start_codon:yes stop_codon:yes gene_type:complete